MPALIGNTSTNKTFDAYTIASKIISFSFANKTGGSINVSFGIVYGSTYYILYNNVVVTATSYIYSGKPIDLPIGYQLYLVVSGSCDYYITIE